MSILALGGALHSAEEATVVPRAIELASAMAAGDRVAHAAIGRLLFVEIWYSPSTREQLKRIRTRA